MNMHGASYLWDPNLRCRSLEGFVRFRLKTLSVMCANYMLARFQSCLRRCVEPSLCSRFQTCFQWILAQSQSHVAVCDRLTAGALERTPGCMRITVVRHHSSWWQRTDPYCSPLKRSCSWSTSDGTPPQTMRHGSRYGANIASYEKSRTTRGRRGFVQTRTAGVACLVGPVLASTSPPPLVLSWYVHVRVIYMNVEISRYIYWYIQIGACRVDVSKQEVRKNFAEQISETMHSALRFPHFHYTKLPNGIGSEIAKSASWRAPFKNQCWTVLPHGKT